MSWIDDQYPDAVGKHTITSDPCGEYNCIAWAAERPKDEWWSHLPGYKWPVRRSPVISSLIKVFESLGYTKVAATDTKIEAEYEKIALYVKGGMWQHASRQLSSGKWTSKLGPDEDIEHNNPECLCGDAYGKLHCIMRRGRNEIKEDSETSGTGR